MEKWKTVPTITLKTGEKFKPYGYEVSTLGRVRSYRNKFGQGPRKLLEKPSLVYGRLDRAGYVQYLLSDKNGVRKNIRGHVVVAFAFIGNRKPGMHICHSDDIKTNNKLSNLRYATAKENGEDRTRNKFSKK